MTDLIPENYATHNVSFLAHRTVSPTWSNYFVKML